MKDPPRYSLTDAFAADAYVNWASRLMAGLYPECDWSCPHAAYLDAGILNYVWRVDVPGRAFYLKQALGRVKEHHRIGADLAAVSPARIQAETRALYFLEEVLPFCCGTLVPRVAWHDVSNNVLWTEAVSGETTSLQCELLAGRCDPGSAEAMGELLALMHQASNAPCLWPSEQEDEENWERFLRMRTTGVVGSHPAGQEFDPAVLKAARALAREARRHARRGMLSHLDAAPKNVLLHPSGAVTLLDFELGANISDPAYDVGFLAGHYLLMGENRPEMRPAARRAATALEGAYRAAAGVDDGWPDRVRRYSGLVLLYRLCGSSPAPCLDPGRYDSIRSEGIRLLLQ